MIQRLLPFLPFAIWIGLILFRGNFWRSDQITSGEAKDLDSWPNVTAVIPARNEAPSIGATVETFPSPSVGHVCRHGDSYDFKFSGT